MPRDMEIGLSPLLSLALFLLLSFAYCLSDDSAHIISELRRMLREIQETSLITGANLVGEFNTMMYNGDGDPVEIAEQVLRKRLEGDPYLSIERVPAVRPTKDILDSLLTPLTSYPERYGVMGYEDDGGYRVTRIAYDSWAWYAGVRDGDLLILRDNSLEVRRGSLTILKLSLPHLSWVEPPVEVDFEYSIHMADVSGVKVLKLKLREFKAGLYLRVLRKLKHTLRRYGEPDVVIFDLRGSPGGSFWEAFYFTCSYIPEGEYSMTMVTREKVRDLYCSDSPLNFRDAIIVVLQDEDTVSAPEVISLTVKPFGFVIGEPSYGKPWLQRKLTADGLSISYTIGYISDLEVLKPHERIVPDSFAYTEEEYEEAIEEIITLARVSRFIW